jgi:hypothetical protein
LYVFTKIKKLCIVLPLTVCVINLLLAARRMQAVNFNSFIRSLNLWSYQKWAHNGNSARERSICAQNALFIQVLWKNEIVCSKYTAQKGKTVNIKTVLGFLFARLFYVAFRSSGKNK